MEKILALVGMPGSGKSVVSDILRKKGFSVVRFGDVTDEEIRKKGIEFNEENERKVREGLRKKYGMLAYAKLNLPRIEERLKKGEKVVVDGLRSWEEYLFLKEKFGDELIVIGVYASPKTRQERLKKRAVRPLSKEESISRDKAEIEQMSIAGPIAMADFTVVNEGGLKELEKAVENVLKNKYL